MGNPPFAVVDGLVMYVVLVDVVALMGKQV